MACTVSKGFVYKITLYTITPLVNPELSIGLNLWKIFLQTIKDPASTVMVLNLNYSHLNCCFIGDKWGNVVKEYVYVYYDRSSMPSPLAPDPIRVQSCVCCLFWTKRNSMAVISIFLSLSLIIQSELWIILSALSVNGNIYFNWNYTGTTY